MKFEREGSIKKTVGCPPLIYIVAPDLALSPQKKETMFHNSVFWELNEESPK
jgi:hypothetical protein